MSDPLPPRHPALAPRPQHRRTRSDWEQGQTEQSDWLKSQTLQSDWERVDQVMQSDADWQQGGQALEVAMAVNDTSQEWSIGQQGTEEMIQHLLQGGSMGLGPGDGVPQGAVTDDMIQHLLQGGSMVLASGEGTQ